MELGNDELVRHVYDDGLDATDHALLVGCDCGGYLVGHPLA